MNLTIRTKLLAGFSLMIALLIAIGLLMTNKLSESNTRLDGIVNSAGKKVSLSKGMLIDVLEATRHEKNLILEKDPARKEYYKGRIYEPLGAIDEKVLELEALADEKGKVILNEFKSSWNGYKPALEEIIALAMRNENEKAYALSIEKGLVVRDKVLVQLNKLVEKNEKSMADDKALNDANYKAALNLIIALVLASLVIAALLSYWIVQSISKRISFITAEAEKIASREHTNDKMEDATNDELRPAFEALVNVNESFREVTANANLVASGDYRVDLVPRSEKDSLGIALKKMTASLRETTAANEKHNWLTAGQNQLNETMRGDLGIADLTGRIVTFLANYLGAQLGAVYLLDEKKGRLQLAGQYGLSAEMRAQEEFRMGEGLIGQAAAEQKQISVSDLSEQQVRITSLVLNAKPLGLFIAPFTFEGETLGVIELGKLTAFSDTEKEFLGLCLESIGISVNSAVARKRIQQLLEETQTQSEELQSQQEELKQMNEELEEQAQNLKQQQEELQMTNEELEEQTQSLELKNKEVEAARSDIEQKTRQLEVSSKYKSEFLANMSHELRTPLNSLLILSRDLAENKKKNLTKDQVESAEIINKSGYDLLGLINEVLDLSKIEAGKMTLNLERLSLKELASGLSRNFKHQTDQKGLKLTISLANDLPEAIRTDAKRLDQVLKNLLSNAVKFTEQGSITVNVKRSGDRQLSISVTDTGIGIAPEKQAAVFEAFHQGDGSTSRKYGGTGLGLSISRELAKLLGGKIGLTSNVNQGSTFTLTIPLELQEEDTAVQSSGPSETAAPKVVETKSFINYPSIDDDRNSIGPNDRVLLVIEDDLKFAGILLKQANAKGFKCIAAATGEDGLLLAAQYKPHAVMLDIDLPGIDGHKVLAELKADPSTRHIPVHMISVNERSMRPIKEGALEYLTKPVEKKQLEEAFNRIENFISRKMKNLLIVEDDSNSRMAMKKLIGNGDVKCFEAGSGQEALSIFGDHHIDCIVLDLGLPDISGFELIRELEKVKKGFMPPIIIYTGKDLSKEENEELQKHAETIIIKGVRSEERLLDETALFLHRTIHLLPESKQKMISGLYDKETIFHGRKVLVVDDDMRNVFALSKVLAERGMNVIKAENGLRALEALDKEPGTDIVLMDIMMPEMDGYEAMKKIREQTRFAKLPVIALTAKAMKDDKQKCIDAGANDYISKPVDLDRLLSLMRVWLSK